MPHDNSHPFNPLVGLEFERYLAMRDGSPIPDISAMENFWKAFAEDPAWKAEIKYDASSGKPIGCVLRMGEDEEITLVNDTGYAEIEYPTKVFTNLADAAVNVHAVFAIIDRHAKKYIHPDAAMLGTGSHPTLLPTPENYFAFRTPKGSLYTLLCEGTGHVFGRNLDHRLYLTVTSDQINIDLPVGKEIDVIRILNRLMAFLVALSANSSFEGGSPGEHKSLRQFRARKMVANSRCMTERVMAGFPDTEFMSMDEYFDQLFNQRRILFLGGSKEDSVVVPLLDEAQTPTLTQFLSRTEPWIARDIHGAEYAVVSDASQIRSPLQRVSFYNIKPQLNFSRSEEITREEYLEAAGKKQFEKLFRDKGVKMFIEIRAIDSALPGHEIALPALVKGLVINFEQAAKIAFDSGMDYGSWREAYMEAATHGIDFSARGKRASEWCGHLLNIARDGLAKVNNGDEVRLLDPLYELVRLEKSPADKAREAYNQGGLQKAVELFTYKPA